MDWTRGSTGPTALLLELLLALLGFGPEGQPDPPGRLDAAETEARLHSATIEIRLPDGIALVRARYRFTPVGDSLLFTALRFEEQAVSLLPTEGEGTRPAKEGSGPENVPGAPPLEVSAAPGAPRLELSTAPGLTRLRGTGRPSGEVRFAYRVTGDLKRIPLFVPPWPSVPGEVRVEIRVLGLGRGGESFPRLVVQPDGSFQARLDNLPSFVRLPATDGGLPLNRVFDGLVISLALLGVGFWLTRHLRASAGRGSPRSRGVR